MVVDCVDSADRVIPSIKDASLEQQKYSLLILDHNTAGVQTWINLIHSFQIDGYLNPKFPEDPNYLHLILIVFPQDKSQIEKQLAMSSGVTNRVTIITKPLKQMQIVPTILNVFTLCCAPVPGPLSSLREEPQTPSQKPIIIVLVVDDNDVNRQVATRMLKRLGCEVQSCNNGEEATEAVENGSYDLVFMDCEMPVKDGFQATIQIRQWESTRKNGNTTINSRKQRLPIIAVTANVLSGDEKRCFEAGMDDYLAKPLQMKDMDDMIQKWTLLRG